MGARERKPLPWGEGIDRASGAMVVDELEFADLRNVYLSNGRAELRKGNARALLFPAGDDVLGVWPIRAQGLSGAVVYKASDLTVSLYAIDASGTVASFVTVLWTMDGLGTLPPSVVAADSYDKLIIAHDEPLFGLRQPTYVFSPSDGTALPLMADFARTGTPAPVRFRGVARHLNYLVGWGYGTSEAEDRGETLRISEAGDPTTFQPEHYFLVGAQGDPIIGCGPCGGVLAVMKTADSYKLIGYDRATFGIRPLDPEFGLLASRLHASVNDEFHFWSLTGPRMSQGEGSVDMASPLNLDGPAPDIIETNTPKDKGFAYLDTTNREIDFVFGQWAYVLHLRDGKRRWSYRELARPLVSAGKMVLGGTISLDITAHAEPDTITYLDPTYVGTDIKPKLVVTWTIVGGTVTTERCEVWAKSFGTGGSWSRRGSFAASALTGTVAVEDFWQTHMIALRLTQSGVAAPPYSNTANPAGWPPEAQTNADTGGEIVDWRPAIWYRFDGTHQGYKPIFKGPGANAAAWNALVAHAPVGSAATELNYVTEKSLDGSTGWTAVDSSASAWALLSLPNSDSLTLYYFRVRVEGPLGDSAWFIMDPVIVAPEAPENVQIGVTDNPGGPNTDLDTHHITWARPAVVDGQQPPPDNYLLVYPAYEVRARHRDTSGGVNFGAYGATLQFAGNGFATDYGVPGYNPSIGVGRTAEAQVRSVQGADVSPWSQNTSVEA